MHPRKHRNIFCWRNARCVCVCVCDSTWWSIKVLGITRLNAVYTVSVPLHQHISTEATQSSLLQADIPVLRPGYRYFPCPYHAVWAGTPFSVKTYHFLWRWPPFRLLSILKRRNILIKTQISRAGYLEDGGSTFLRNVGTTLPNFTVLHPRRL
jgi:hypothetical protein